MLTPTGPVVQFFKEMVSSKNQRKRGFNKQSAVKCDSPRSVEMNERCHRSAGFRLSSRTLAVPGKPLPPGVSASARNYPMMGKNMWQKSVKDYWWAISGS